MLAGIVSPLVYGATQQIVHNGNSTASATLLANAVNAAQSGDTILVSEGTFAFSTSWDQPAMTLKCGVTLIGSGNQTIFTYSGGGRLINLADATPDLDDAAYIGNVSIVRQQGQGGLSGGAILADGATVRLRMEECNVSSKMGDGGGAMYINNGAYVEVHNSVFQNCEGQAGGAFRVRNSTLNISDSKIYENSSQQGGALYVDGGIVHGDHCNIYNNNLNGSGQGGAGYLINNAEVYLDYCNITGNSSSNGGAGFFLNGYNILVLNYSTMVGNNNVGWAAGGISADEPCDIQINNSIVTGNTTVPGAQESLGNDLPPEVVPNIEGSVIGDSIIVSNDPEADCQPNCSYGIDSSEVEIVPDDSGYVSITLPPTVDDGNGGTITNPIANEDGTPKGGSEGNDQGSITLTLIAADTVLCHGDSTTLTLNMIKEIADEEPTTYHYKLIRVEQSDQDTLRDVIDSLKTSGMEVIFQLKPRSSRVAECFEAEVWRTRGNDKHPIKTTPSMHVLILPVVVSAQIAHSKNEINNP